MADRTVDHLIIGGGIAAVSAARTLREEGADGSIVVVSRELDPPYHRPALTKEYLRGEQDRDDVLLVEDSWWADNDIELMTRASVTALDPAGAVATLASKQQLEFRTAILATGAMIRRLSVDGAQLDGLHYLRTLGTSDTLRKDLADGAPVVCIGGSYIACEVAASLTVLGHPVTMVMMEREPLSNGFGFETGMWFRSVLEEHGVAIIGESTVQRFEGEERIERVVLEGGKSIDAQLVVAGVGVTPDVGLAGRAGLVLGETGGVRCDGQLRTSAPAIWAAGDMCEYASVVHDGQPIRVEHEIHAEEQGRTAARNALGARVDHEAVPYFFSDLADWASLEYVGPAREWDEEVVVGDRDSGDYSVWYLQGGRLRAVLAVGDAHDDLERGQAAIAERATMTADEIRGG